MEYSVLMSVYKNDNPQYLKKALLSMVNQTKKPDEIILVKDGQITKELQITIDEVDRKSGYLIKQIQLVNNLGLGLALNEGLKYCKNQIIARMDADDISMLNRCEKQIAEFEKDKDLDIVGSSVLEFVNEIENIVSIRNVPLDNNEIYKYCKTRDPFNHPTVMYRKNKIEEVGGYSNLRKNQDTDLWIKLLLNKAKCLNISEPLLYFRFDENTYKKRKSWLNTKLLIKIRWKAYRNGFSTIFDFIKVLITQICIFILPLNFQKIIYKYLLRKYK